jgi:hypothetical protein
MTNAHTSFRRAVRGRQDKLDTRPLDPGFERRTRQAQRPLTASVAQNNAR